jgi:predicted transcriptional regulator
MATFERILENAPATLNATQLRVLAIAKGEYKPGKNDPKVWFESLESLAQVLSDQNRALLKLINEKHPQSLSELAE